MSEVKRMSMTEFRDTGYLQELHRKFLHPLGLALDVIIDEDGTEWIGGIWDARADPGGIAYGGNAPDLAKAKRVRHLEEERKPARRSALGYWLQPADAD